MALVFKDRVKDVSTTSGTGNLTLSGTAPLGYKAFGTAYATGSTNQFQYCVVDNTTGDWEIGAGYLSAATTLVRSTVLSNSLNTTAKISFAANSKDVFVTASANAINAYGPADAYSTIVLGYNTANNVSTANNNSVYIGTNVASAGITSAAVGNTIVGGNAGSAITSANGNTFIGQSAGTVVTTATNSTMVGAYAGGGFGAGITSGSDNALFGVQVAWKSNGSALSIFGTYASLNNTGSNNTVMGFKALYGTSGSSTGGNNSVFGYSSGYSLTTAVDNVFFGYNSGNATTSGGRNIYIGSAAGQYQTTGTENVCLGIQAGVLYYAGAPNFSYGTYIGAYAGQYNSGNNNVAVGQTALKGTGTSSTGGNNVAVGCQAGLGITTGANNVLLGYSAGSAITTGSNNLVFGNNAQASTATVNNEITLGDANITAIRSNVQTITSLSDVRDKTDITSLPLGLDFINTLKPVKFQWDRRDGTMKGVEDLGFIAQDLDAAQLQFAAEDYLDIVNHSNPDKLEASYGKLIPVLVKAIQELSEEVNILKGL